jgi:hypothetical protein
MEGWGGLLCYSSTFSLLHASRDHALGPYAYSVNSNVSENYYTQQKKMRGRGELDPIPQLWYHARRHLICQSNHKTQVIWKGWGGLLWYSPTIEQQRNSHRAITQDILILGPTVRWIWHKWFSMNLVPEPKKVAKHMKLKNLMVHLSEFSWSSSRDW